MTGPWTGAGDGAGDGAGAGTGWFRAVHVVVHLRSPTNTSAIFIATTAVDHTSATVAAGLSRLHWPQT